jgi:hypothetical protein
MKIKDLPKSSRPRERFLEKGDVRKESEWVWNEKSERERKKENV